MLVWYNCVPRGRWVTAGARGSCRKPLTCLLKFSPFAARRRIDLREVGRLCVDWSAAIGHCASNDFSHTYSSRPAGLLLGVPRLGRNGRIGRIERACACRIGARGRPHRGGRIGRLGDVEAGHAC